MRCDVCDTKIPLGANECPNCGYKVKKETVQTFDATSSTHEHIQTPKRIRTLKTKKSDLSIVGIISLVVSVVVLIATVVGLVMSMYAMISDVFIESEQVDEMTFQEIIDEGYDDGSVQMAMEKGKDMQEFMTGIFGENLEVYEYVSDYDDLRAYVDVEGYTEDGTYSLRYGYSQGELYSYGLTYSGYSMFSIQTDIEKAVDKDLVNQLSAYLGIENGYDLIDDAHLRLEKDDDSDDSSYYLNSSYPYIYVSETQYVDGEYRIYWKISDN